MAIYNGRILMRKGNEADFDPSKLMSGEWAVSLDAGIVRICLEAGKVIRMATYEAFEKDMEQIEEILLECKSIEEAVIRINDEVSNKLNACAEYVQQAKNYSEQAKTSEANAKSYMQSAKTSEENAKVSETNAKASENSAKEYENSAKLTEERAREVFESIPEDYSTISNDLYELAIKETASGEEIHVNDSSNLKLREFALYGKAKQNTTTGKNLLNNTNTTQTINGVTFTVNEDKSVTVNGTATADAIFPYNSFVLPSGEYILSGCPLDGGGGKYYLQYTNYVDGAFMDSGKGVKFTPFDLEQYPNTKVRIVVKNGITVNNLTFYPMIRLASITDSTYEPFTNGASPNPQYPQPIEVSGASGSVEVKSCGKNLFDKTAPLLNGQNFDNYGNEITEGSVDWGIHDQYIRVEPLADYTISGNIVPINWEMKVAYYDINKNPINMQTIQNNTGNIVLNIPENIHYIRVRINSMRINKDIVQMEKGMITEYQPYKETIATIPTTDFAGIPVSSGGNYTDSNGQQWICDEVVKYADGSGEYIQRIYNVDTTKAVYNASLSTVSRFVVTKVPEPLWYGSAQIYKSSHFNFKDGYSLDEQHWYVYNGTCYLFVPNEIASNQNDIDNYFADGNVIQCMYAIAEPITTPLTAEEIAEIEKLHTFYPVTNISNDFDCGMSVTYNCDSKNYIGNQLAIMKQEQEEAMANMLLLMPTEVQATMIENDTNDLLKESEI